MKLQFYHNSQEVNMQKESRYIRQRALPQVGNKGQLKIRTAKVLVIGCGGLGCAVLPYLVAAGVGKIGIVDGDIISQSNLHRQILFSENDIGFLKVSVAANKLKAQNSEVIIQQVPEYLDVTNAISLFENYDIIVDATDRIPIRYLINDACVLTDKPFVHAALFRFQIQVSVFNYQNGPTYRCLYPNPASSSQSCNSAGVLGTSVALAGTLQANEVMKMILGIGTVLSGKVLLNDTLNNSSTQFTFRKRVEKPKSRTLFTSQHTINKVSFTDVESKESIFLDVRFPKEKPEINSDKTIGIPLSQLSSALSKIPSDKEIYIFCQTGKRSEEAYKILQNQNYNTMYCLIENAVELKTLLKS